MMHYYDKVGCFLVIPMLSQDSNADVRFTVCQSAALITDSVTHHDVFKSIYLNS